MSRDDGEGKRADGEGKKAIFEHQKADGDRLVSATDCDDTKDDETKDDNDDDDDCGGGRSADDLLSTKDDRQTLVDLGDANDDDNERATVTAQSIEFLVENDLLRNHVECRGPDDSLDHDEVEVTVVDDEDEDDDRLDRSGRFRPFVSAGCRSAIAKLRGFPRPDEERWAVIHASRPSRRRRLTVYSERIRSNVSTACLSAIVTSGDFFRWVARRTGYVLRLEFFAGSTIYSGTLLERPF